MKKGYYIHFEGRSSIGVSKKIDMQTASLSKHFDMGEVEVHSVKRSLLQRILGLFPTASIKRDYKSALLQLENPDFLYIRRAVADRAYVNFWKTIKEKYPNCKIIIEVFTYPYDKDEFARRDAWPFYIKELLYRGKLKKYVDAFVTYSEDTEIFGIPTIRTINGIQLETISPARGAYQENKITLMAVAYMQSHHGYERLIEGLQQYYQNAEHKYTIKLLLIGDGPEKPFYQSLVRKYQMENHVQFYPTLSGDALDEMYDISDIALASFGTYKKGVYTRLSALKTREYLAKGMPIITGCEIDVLDSRYAFVMNCPNNAEPVNMEEVAAFYDRIKQKSGNKQTVISTIRQFAESHVSIDSAMKPIVDYIDSPQR